MGTLTKKPSVDVLKVVGVTLILCVLLTSEAAAAVAEAPTAEAPGTFKEGEESRKFERKSEDNEYKVAMPLYRVKDRPGVLIPGSKLQTSTTFFPGKKP